jgi:hypothetical protein
MDHPASVIGIPFATGLAHELAEFRRAADGDPASEVEYDRTDLPWDGLAHSPRNAATTAA